MKKAYLFILLIPFFSLTVSAQVSVKDSSIYTPLVGVSYGYYFSDGDMAKRFGNSSSLMLNVDFKTQKYWTIGLNGSYFFGKDIKESLFDSIAGADGSLINKKGEIADIRLYERGFTVSVSFGRMFAFKKPNPNSGILFNVGVGIMQHKIRIETIGNDTPQLSKQYKKGYDRLSNGLLLSENIGYLYLSNNRLQNFYIGFECMQGFTQSRRSFDYELMAKDTHKRLDILYGGKITWYLPLYKKAPSAFYYN
jgi:hypothetical protein